MKYVAKEYVRGTTRRRVVTDGGSLLESQTVYLPGLRLDGLESPKLEAGTLWESNYRKLDSPGCDVRPFVKL